MRIMRQENCHCIAGEGPVWDPAAQALFFFDYKDRKVFRHHPASAETRVWELPDDVGALGLCENGNVIVTLTTGIYVLDIDTGAVTLIGPLAEPSLFAFNDGKVDRRGRFIIGASDLDRASLSPVGGIYSLDANRRLTRVAGDIRFSNGPCWSPDDRTFYMADSLRREIFVYDYDIATGEVANRRRFADLTELGSPDGATVDSDGLLWMAIYDQFKVVAFRPDGRLERVVEMPVRQPSSLMFGGPGLDQLFVTSFESYDTNGVPEPGSGDIYRIDDLGVRGIAEPKYAG